jgi:two-component system nitrogen regulation sensor histidine kinase NtrY
MVFKKFYIQVIIRIVLITATSAWFAFEINDPPRFYTSLFLGLLLIVQVWGLIHYVNKTNRELSRFFASLRDKESSFSLEPDDESGSFSDLADILNETGKIIRDARIEEEKQFRYLQFIIDHVNIGLLSYRADGLVVHYNSTSRNLLGIKEIGNINSLNKLHPDFTGILANLKPGQSAIVKIMRDSGQQSLLIRMTEFLFDAEKLHLISLQDIQTELDEQELLSWKRMIRVLNHEVMNSITPIRTLSHAINRSIEESGLNHQTDPNVRATINDIHKNTWLIEERSSGLIEFINQYRDITKIRELEKTEITIDKLFNEVLTLFKTDLVTYKIDYSLNIEPAELSLECDNNLFRQVLINLVKNAIEALMSVKNGRIELNAGKTNGHFWLQVMDNGQGISPDHQDDIFTPFFSTKESGSGIGLSFAKHIVRLHEGNITLCSEPGKGTAITIKF